MDLDILIHVCFGLFILAFAGHIFTTWKRIKALKKVHELQLRIKHRDGYTEGYRDGWDQSHILDKIHVNVRNGTVKLEEPALGEMVQHCNSRTDYEFINHPYGPDNCKHCLEIRQIVQESN